MTEYLIINIIVSCWVLAVNRLMPIQAKYKFTLLIIAISSWSIPFGLASFQSNSAFFEQAQSVISSVKVPVSNLITQTQTSLFAWESQLFLLLMLGFIRFLIDVFQLYKQHQLYMTKGQATTFKNVFCIKGLNNACVSGLFKPKIWIDESLYYSDSAETIIIHEQQHINGGDNFWLLWITLFQRLFWFNPVMWLLVNQARLALELRCDAACQQQSQNKKYQAELAQILLQMNQQTSSTINHMSHSPQSNMIRIKQLSQETTMNKIHHTFLYATAFIILTLSINLLAKTTNGKPALATNEVLLDISLAMSSDQPLDKKQFSVLTQNGESTTVKIGDLKLELKPNIIKQDSERTTILTELIIYDPSTQEISRPSLMSYNRKNAVLMIDNEENENTIILELTATTKE
ncbi:MAG: M56 family metallopeptidase [Marinicella sp.]|nr:M56 family metallopeptidase [Xanthomonadales bacterium]